MNIESTVRKEYNLNNNDRLYISGRFYKKDSDVSFCCLVVFSTHSIVCEFKDQQNKYSPVFIGEIHRGVNGTYEYPKVIREWTKRNIVWKWERQ